MRLPLVPLASLLAVAACYPQPASDTPFLGANRVNINVTCQGKEVTVTVIPWTAHAAASEPMEWHIARGAHVMELEINQTVAGNWPFTEQLPYRSTPGKAAQAQDRAGTWQRGSTAHYKITGICKNGQGPSYPFVLDPDMIVD